MMHNQRLPGTGPAVTDEVGGSQGGWKHWALMALCCLPMIAIIVLIALGYWGLR